MEEVGTPEAFKKPPTITCRACGQRHGARYMCEPLSAFVGAIMDAAEANDVPITEFVERRPMPDNATSMASMLGEGKVLCRQIMIKGGVVPFQVAGKPVITQPALIFTGQDADGKELPNWVFVGSPYELRAIRDVCDRMTEMAIRRAAE